VEDRLLYSFAGNCKHERIKKMTKYQDKVSEATEELSESVLEANRAIADSVVAAQERNWKFAQSIFENEVELFKSHTESSRTVLEKLAGESEKGQSLFQAVADSAVAARERNLQFVQGVLENGTDVLRSHVEGTRTLMQTLTEQSQKQREAFGVIARGAWDAYRGFFPSPFSYYEKAMETAETIATQGGDAVQKMARQGMGTAEKVNHHERQSVDSATQ
jgi:hypothetical protein